MTPGFYLTKQNEQRRKRKGKQNFCISQKGKRHNIFFLDFIFYAIHSDSDRRLNGFSDRIGYFPRASKYAMGKGLEK